MLTSADAPGITSFTPDQLVRVARLFANDVSLSVHLENLPDDGARRRVSLAQTPHLEMWAIIWPVGVMSEWHDHGSAAGAFVVARGALIEEVWAGNDVTTHLYGEQEHRSFGSGLVHRTGAFGDEVALSVHAYAPGLSDGCRFDVVDGALVELAEPVGR